jgi:cytochrome d ubiquinol oxidase subunit II
VTEADAVVLMLFAGIVLYTVAAGADFGSGFWDLLAGGDRRGATPRRLIDQAIGPVWEANHVWLIFVLVMLWTGFPQAFGPIMLTLWIPLSLAALGIVLRGSGFAFRRMVDSVRAQRVLGAAFATSSIIVPFCMGAIAGGIASGRVPADGSGDRVTSWINPTSALGGVLAVTVCAYLAGMYLANDAHRFEELDQVDYFRRRAVIAGIVAGVVAGGGVFVLRHDSPFLFDNLLGRALPLMVVSGLAGVGALVLLVRGRPGLARMSAVLAVATVVTGWGVAQWPYLLPETLEVNDAGAPAETLITLIVVFAIAVVILVPSIGLLYWLDQRSLIGEVDSTVGRGR